MAGTDSEPDWSVTCAAMFDDARGYRYDSWFHGERGCAGDNDVQGWGSGYDGAGWVLSSYDGVVGDVQDL